MGFRYLYHRRFVSLDSWLYSELRRTLIALWSFNFVFLSIIDLFVCKLVSLSSRHAFPIWSSTDSVSVVSCSFAGYEESNLGDHIIYFIWNWCLLVLFTELILMDLFDYLVFTWFLSLDLQVFWGAERFWVDERWTLDRILWLLAKWAARSGNLTVPNYSIIFRVMLMMASMMFFRL